MELAGIARETEALDQRYAAMGRIADASPGSGVALLATTQPGRGGYPSLPRSPPFLVPLAGRTFPPPRAGLGRVR